MHFKRPAYTLASFLGVLVAACIFSVSSASAQITERAAPFRGSGDFNRELQPRSATMHTIRLPRVPESWLTLRGPRTAIKSRRVPQASGAIVSEYALTVIREDRYGNHCRVTANDHVDLRRLKANGYQLVRYRVIEHKEPAGYTTKPRYLTRPPVNAAQADGVGVSWTFGRNMLIMQCWSGYSLDIEVRGPRNIDPVTGQKIARSPVN